MCGKHYRFADCIDGDRNKCCSQYPSGGIAKAVCDFCYGSYGTENPVNHSGTEQWIKTAATHTKKWSCCGAQITEIEDHKWVDGICGNAYGETDANNHENLAHFPAKAATKDAEGNIEYYRCDGCGKYYRDAAATRKISEADTVTVKLPDDPKPPQTGDNSRLTVLIALLSVCGDFAHCQ